MYIQVIKNECQLHCIRITGAQKSSIHFDDVGEVIGLKVANSYGVQELTANLS